MGRLLDPDPSPSHTQTCDLSKGHHTIQYPSGSRTGNCYTSASSSWNCHLSIGRYGDRDQHLGLPSPVPGPVTRPEAVCWPGTHHSAVLRPFILREAVCRPRTHCQAVPRPVTHPEAVCQTRTRHLAAPGPVTRQPAIPGPVICPEGVKVTDTRHPGLPILVSGPVPLLETVCLPMTHSPAVSGHVTHPGAVTWPYLDPLSFQRPSAGLGPAAQLYPDPSPVLGPSAKPEPIT